MRSLPTSPARRGAVLAVALSGLTAAMHAGASADEAVPGLVTDWSLSQPVSVSTIDVERYPDLPRQQRLQWQAVKGAPDGLVDVARYQKQPASGGVQVFARTTLRAAQKETRAFAFGHAGRISVYLNGRPLLRAENAPRDRQDSRGGPDWSDTLWLPLEAGENELLVAVANTGDGWAFKGRDLDAVCQHPRLAKLWELADLSAAPESVAYDAQRRVLYVSDFTGGGIAKIAPDGRILADRWIGGLQRPTGLKLFRGRLYAVERPGVAEIDPDSGQIARRYAIEGSAFPNDLALDGSGSIYVTDSASDRIYRIADGKAELWLQDVAVDKPNGVMLDSARLLVDVTEEGAVKIVDLATKHIATLAAVGPGTILDGLVGDGKGGCLFSDYYGRIFHVDAAGAKTVLLDRSGPRQFCADFEYVPEEGLLIVPSLFDHRLTAYRLRTEDL